MRNYNDQNEHKCRHHIIIFIILLMRIEIIIILLMRIEIALFSKLEYLNAICICKNLATI